MLTICIPNTYNIVMDKKVGKALIRLSLSRSGKVVDKVDEYFKNNPDATRQNILDDLKLTSRQLTSAMQTIKRREADIQYAYECWLRGADDILKSKPLDSKD